MSRTKTVAVDILDKQYQVACPTDERGALIAAAHHLDQNMRDIRSSGKVIGLERVAIMAALNITHELLELRDGNCVATESVEDKERMLALSSQLDEALYQLRQLEIS